MAFRVVYGRGDAVDYPKWRDMKTTPDNVKEFILQGLDCEHIAVEGDGRHFFAVIVSKKFEGIGMLQQHRVVYQVLGDKMERIHALSMKTLTPQQWTQQQN